MKKRLIKFVKKMNKLDGQMHEVRSIFPKIVMGNVTIHIPNQIHRVKFQIFKELFMEVLHQDFGSSEST